MVLLKCYITIHERTGEKCVCYFFFPKETISMKCHEPIFWVNKENISLSSAAFAQGVVKVDQLNCMFFCWIMFTFLLCQ